MKKLLGALLLILATFLCSATHAQVMNVELEGDAAFTGNLSVGGTIAAGSGGYSITNTSGYLLGNMIQSATVGSSQLASSCVAETKIATNAVTDAKIAESAVTSAKIASAAVTPYKLSTTGTYGVKKLGIDTSAVPHGGIGYSDLSIDGPNADYDCPAIEMTTTADDYPIINISAWSHNSAAIRFDCYYDNGTPMQRSSSNSSNAAIMKNGNDLMLTYSPAGN